MPKQEVGSTKWLGNKMKAKGLQKLRWYCQMCQKQCRDENGFKCHRMSDGHQRQMQLFVQDPNKFMDDFSQEFEQGFMKLMSHSYRSQRVLANTIYCDYISNRHHTHMNSTIWVTLSNFVQYLGRTGQCEIDKTPKGWYLVYIDNSPEAQLRRKQREEEKGFEIAEEERHEMLLRQQIEEAKKDGGFQESEFTELQREEGDAPISFAMGGSSSSSSAGPIAAARANAEGSASKRERSGGSNERNVLEDAFAAHGGTAGGGRGGSPSVRTKDAQPSKISVMEKVRLEHEAAKKRRLGEETSAAAPSALPGRGATAADSDESPARGPAAWLAAGLVVKVMHQDLADGKFYRKKGKVEKVHDRYTADVRMIEGKSLIRLEQEMLETVIPNVGKPVRIVKGTHKGWRAVMRKVDIEGFCVGVELEDGTEMDGLGYDEVCKIDD
mmetsp:Transcript_99557/g.187232  ORF Transcript_99557/g.187232 Transcript_99557/m.187232 type:complete len:439 (-) Transcript_99557:50-1366(-)